MGVREQKMKLKKKCQVDQQIEIQHFSQNSQLNLLNQYNEQPCLYSVIISSFRTLFSSYMCTTFQDEIKRRNIQRMEAHMHS